MEQRKDEKFDSKTFADLTCKAMANRKPSEFAKQLQIDSKYLIDLLKGFKQTPPKLDVIEKIAKESCGKVNIEELTRAAGYTTSDAFPNSKKLSEKIGTWEIVCGRLMNREALQEYLKQMMRTMSLNEFAAKAEVSERKVQHWLTDSHLTVQDANRLFEKFSTDKMDYDDFIDVAGYRGSQYKIHLKKNLNPDKIEIPEELLKKFSKKKKEVKPESSPQKAVQVTETTKVPDMEVTPKDLAELAVLRYVRKQGKSFTIQGADMDRIIIKREDGHCFIFNLSLIGAAPSELDILKFYKECATISSETCHEYYGVFTDKAILDSIKTISMKNLIVHPSASLISGAQVIKSEEL